MPQRSTPRMLTHSAPTRRKLRVGGVARVQGEEPAQRQRLLIADLVIQRRGADKGESPLVKFNGSSVALSRWFSRQKT